MIEQYNKKYCLVTGGKGFIGTALVNCLLELGAFVQTYDLKDNQDVFDYAKLTSYVKDMQYVFHLAALTEVGSSYQCPIQYYRTNFNGTLNLLEACHFHKIESIVIASTDKVYGDNFLPFNESLYLHSSPDPYSNSKRFADEIAQQYRNAYSLPIRILRSVNTYGPGQRNSTTLIINTINRILDRVPIEIHHNYSNSIREWLYIDDAVNAFLHAGILSHTETLEVGYIWNVGSGEIRRVDEIIGLISHILNVYISQTVNSISKDRVKHQHVNSQLFRQMMQYCKQYWKPVSIEDGLRKTIEWYINNRHKS